MVTIPRSTPQGASISEIHEGLKNFINSYVRIDEWTINNPPDANPRQLAPNPAQPDVLAPYPPNTAFCGPIRRANVYREKGWGLTCAADFYFEIAYRFDKGLRYDQLPFIQAENLINNLYFFMTGRPAQVNHFARTIETPDIGIEVAVGHIQDATSDWLVILRPAFRVTFRIAPGDIGVLQPGPPVLPPITLNQIKLDIHRAYPNEINQSPPDFDPSVLDRTLTINYVNPTPSPTPAPTPTPSPVPVPMFGMNL